MPAYLIQIRHDSLGAAGPRFETVSARGEDPAAAIILVRTALRLDGEVVELVRELADDEAAALGLKPFQVKHLPPRGSS